MSGTCPLCGSLVRVHTADEGTACYVSVAERAIREALRADHAQIHGNPYGRLLALRKALRRGLGEMP